MRSHQCLAAAITAAVVAIVFSMFAQPVQASFVYYVEQSGSNVIITGSGSFNTTTLGAPLGSFNNFNAITTGSTSITTGSTLSTPSNIWTPVQIGGPAFSSLAAPKNPISSTGPQMTFQSNNLLILPTSYVSGSTINSVTIFANSTLSEFGWTAGTYASPVTNKTWNLSNGETVQVVGVPEPSNFVLAAMSALVLGGWHFRSSRQRKDSIATMV